MLSTARAIGYSWIAHTFRAVGDRASRRAWRILNPPPVPRPENSRLRNIHAGQRAFVIGNGPSLASQDLSVLKGELLFTMNSFDRHPMARELAPVYHHLADPLLASGTPETEEMLLRIERGIGDSQIFIPAWGPTESARLRQWRSDGRLWFVPMRGSLADDPVDALEMSVRVPEVQSTSQLAIMTAIYMGCNPIYLLGLDSDWAASMNLDRHFYIEPTLNREPGTGPKPLTYQTILECTLRLWKGYTHLRDYCEPRTIEVFNCTAGGLLDVFPRKTFDEVVSQLAEPEPGRAVPPEIGE